MNPENDTTHPLDSDDEERYFLAGRREVSYALKELIDRGEMVTISFNFGADFLLTTLLAIDQAANSLIFDWGGSEEADRKLLKSERSIFVAKPDGIKMQFVAGEVKQTTFGDCRAFRTGLPQRIIRLQRRESYRVATPVARPLRCHVAPDTKEQPLALSSHDLSVDGIGLTTLHGAERFEVGMRLSRVRVELPDFGEIACAAQVRHITPLSARGAGASWRIGLQFHGITHLGQARIQRYIVAQERLRRSMTPD